MPARRRGGGPRSLDHATRRECRLGTARDPVTRRRSTSGTTAMSAPISAGDEAVVMSSSGNCRRSLARSESARRSPAVARVTAAASSAAAARRRRRRTVEVTAAAMLGAASATRRESRSPRRTSSPIARRWRSGSAAWSTIPPSKTSQRAAAHGFDERRVGQVEAAGRVGPRAASRGPRRRPSAVRSATKRVHACRGRRPTVIPARWLMGNTTASSGRLMPSIGTAAIGRSVARSRQREGDGDRRWRVVVDRNQGVPAVVGDRPHTLDGITPGDAQLGLEDRRPGDAAVTQGGGAARIVPAVGGGDVPPEHGRAVVWLDEAGGRDVRPPSLAHHSGRRHDQRAYERCHVSSRREPGTRPRMRATERQRGSVR